MTATTLPFWHVAIGRDVAAVRLPDGVDPGHVRIAPAHSIRTGDLVVGFVDDGPVNGRDGMWGSSPHPRAFYALPVAGARYAAVLTLDGFRVQAQRHDEVLYVPAEWCPVAYAPGSRVERIGLAFGTRPGERERTFVQRGTVDQVDDGDGTLTVRWDGGTDVFRTFRDMIRPVDDGDVAEERELCGVATGDLVTFAGGLSRGLVLELRRRSFHGPVEARVLWDVTGFRAAYEEFRLAADLCRAVRVPSA